MASIRTRGATSSDHEVELEFELPAWEGALSKNAREFWEELSATICIVDERTYLVIDVIPSESQRADRADRAQLILSAEQTRFIFANVAKDATTNVNVLLALGAEVRPDIEMLAFREDVLRRLPEMERCR